MKLGRLLAIALLTISIGASGSEPADHRVGDKVTIPYQERYVDPFPGDPSKIIFSKDSDRMKSWYDYYIFDAAEFQEQEEQKYLGKKLPADMTFLIVAKRDKVESGDVRGARPDGGFSNTYYECEELEFS